MKKFMSVIFVALMLGFGMAPLGAMEATLAKDALEVGFKQGSKESLDAFAARVGKAKELGLKAPPAHEIPIEPTKRLAAEHARLAAAEQAQLLKAQEEAGSAFVAEKLKATPTEEFGPKVEPGPIMSGDVVANPALVEARAAYEQAQLAYQELQSEVDRLQLDLAANEGSVQQLEAKRTQLKAAYDLAIRAAEEHHHLLQQTRQNFNKVVEEFNALKSPTTTETKKAVVQLQKLQAKLKQLDDSSETFSDDVKVIAQYTKQWRNDFDEAENQVLRTKAAYEQVKEKLGPAQQKLALAQQKLAAAQQAAQEAEQVVQVGVADMTPVAGTDQAAAGNAAQKAVNQAGGDKNIAVDNLNKEKDVLDAKTEAAQAKLGSATPAERKGILAQIKAWSTRRKVITGAIALLVVGGVTTGIVLGTRKSSGGGQAAPQQAAMPATPVDTGVTGVTEATPVTMGMPQESQASPEATPGMAGPQGGAVMIPETPQTTPVVRKGTMHKGMRRNLVRKGPGTKYSAEHMKETGTRTREGMSAQEKHNLGMMPAETKESMSAMASE